MQFVLDSAHDAVDLVGEQVQQVLISDLWGSGSLRLLSFLGVKNLGNGSVVLLKLRCRFAIIEVNQHVSQGRPQLVVSVLHSFLRLIMSLVWVLILLLLLVLLVLIITLRVLSVLLVLLLLVSLISRRSGSLSLLLVLTVLRVILGVLHSRGVIFIVHRIFNNSK